MGKHSQRSIWRRGRGALGLFLVLLVGVVPLVSAQNPSEGRTFTDLEGNSVIVPSQVKTTGTSWPGFINMLLTVGGGEKLVASTKTITNYPWALKVFPALKTTPFPFGTQLAAEDLVRAKPDVVFLRKGDPVDKVKQLGIPVVMIKYPNNSIYDLGAAAELAGQVLGEREAAAAALYKQTLNRAIALVAAGAKGVTRPLKVLALSVTGKELSAWGRNMPQDEVIRLVGAQNAAGELDGYKPVSLEQVFAWNPDVVIVEGNAADREILNNDAWKGVAAVKNGKVFVSPQGVFAWARLGSELALYIPWVAKTVYPDLFSIDLVKETKTFYNTYFHYPLTDDEAQRILGSLPPL